jgi:hypothetical protein
MGRYVEPRTIQAYIAKLLEQRKVQTWLRRRGVAKLSIPEIVYAKGSLDPRRHQVGALYMAPNTMYFSQWLVVDREETLSKARHEFAHHLQFNGYLSKEWTAHGPEFRSALMAVSGKENFKRDLRWNMTPQIQEARKRIIGSMKFKMVEMKNVPKI